MKPPQPGPLICARAARRGVQVNLRLFQKRRTTLLFVIRDKTRTPEDILQGTLRDDLAAIWAGIVKPERHVGACPRRLGKLCPATMEATCLAEEGYAEGNGAVRRGMLVSQAHRVVRMQGRRWTTFSTSILCFSPTLRRSPRSLWQRRGCGSEPEDSNSAAARPASGPEDPCTPCPYLRAWALCQVGALSVRFSERGSADALCSPQPSATVSRAQQEPRGAPPKLPRPPLSLL